MTADPLVRVTGLRKAFGAHRVLDGLTLEVLAGEAVALLGANGAGKTTLLKILATLVRPTRGTVLVAGHDCAREPERETARGADRPRLARLRGPHRARESEILDGARRPARGPRGARRRARGRRARPARGRARAHLLRGGGRGGAPPRASPPPAPPPPPPP